MATEPVDKNTISLITTVGDTGIGISESDLGKIFDPYYQGMVSDEVDNLGAGLGLNLVKRL
jgi:signal transduction histidine kinase